MPVTSDIAAQTCNKDCEINSLRITGYEFNTKEVISQSCDDQVIHPLANSGAIKFVCYYGC